MKLLPALALCLIPLSAKAAPIGIVAAENFYGDVARQIGGPAVTVSSILSNPNQDPHLFELSPGVGRAVSAARIVVYSGIGYDPWMANLLRADRAGARDVIVVADLAGRLVGDNPHVWYDVRAMLAYAARLTEVLAARDRGDAALFQANLAQFRRSAQAITARIAVLRARLAGTPVAATEPIFGDMFAALGMPVRDYGFQLAVMNDTEPSARDIAGLEQDLSGHVVKLLVYNAQASDSAADRIKRLAARAGIPVVAAFETEPAGASYQTWMNDALDAVARALPAAAK